MHARASFPPPHPACSDLIAPPRFIENEVRLNILGLMNTYIASAKQMVKQGFGGRILGAGSIASYRTAGEYRPRMGSGMHS